MCINIADKSIIYAKPHIYLLMLFASIGNLFSRVIKPFFSWRTSANIFSLSNPDSLQRGPLMRPYLFFIYYVKVSVLSGND